MSFLTFHEGRQTDLRYGCTIYFRTYIKRTHAKIILSRLFQFDKTLKKSMSGVWEYNFRPTIMNIAQMTKSREKGIIMTQLTKSQSYFTHKNKDKYTYPNIVVLYSVTTFVRIEKSVILDMF